MSKKRKKYVEPFCRALAAKLTDGGSSFEKEYLRLLVDEITVEGKEVSLKGSHRVAAGVVEKTRLGHSFSEMPSLALKWLPGQDSNLQPTG